MDNKTSQLNPASPQRSRRTFETWAWAVGAVLIPAALVTAAGPLQIEKTFETTPSPFVSVQNLKGRVVVRGWDKAQVHAVCHLASPRVELDATRLPAKDPADKIHLVTHVVDAIPSDGDETADYEIDVPAGATLEVHDPQGSIQIQGVAGDTSVDSVSGNVSVSDAGGHLSVRTVGGDIAIVRAAGRVEASSIDGSLHLIRPTGPRVRGSTTTGKIVYEGNFVPGGDYILSEYSGNMDILCPTTASFELNATTVRGKLENLLPMKPRRGSASPFGPANSFIGTSNSGNATVEVRSFSGTITIRPLP